MASFIVKHLVEERGPIESVIRKFDKEPPYAYTSKKSEAKDAENGKYVYVVRCALGDFGISYSLAYRFIARACFSRPGLLWDDKFKFKVSAEYGSPQGEFFTNPIPINDPDFVSWLKGERRGMVKLSTKNLSVLQAIFVDHAHIAKVF